MCFLIVVFRQTLCRFVFLSCTRVYYDGLLECLQQANDVDITMAYTQQDARSITQEITKIPRIWFINNIWLSSYKMEQIWNTKKRMMHVVDSASKVEWNGEYRTSQVSSKSHTKDLDDTTQSFFIMWCPL